MYDNVFMQVNVHVFMAKNLKEITLKTWYLWVLSLSV